MPKKYNQEKNPTLKCIHSDITKLATRIRNKANANGLMYSTLPSCAIADECPKELERLISRNILLTQMSKSKLNELTEFVECEQERIIAMIQSKDAAYGNENQLKSSIADQCQSIIRTLQEAYNSRHKQVTVNRINFALGAIGTIGTIASSAIAIAGFFC